MGKSLYLECEAGISGDMAVAALLDLGADEGVLENVLASLPLEGYTIEISRVMKNGLDCCDFNVKLGEPNYDHDMEYLHGEKPYVHDCEHNHEHHHDKDNNNYHIEHVHTHRHLSEIYRIIDAGNMTEASRNLSKKIFKIIAEAEGKAHGKPSDKVGFHEVGAVDSIIDVISFAVCYDNLGIEKTYITKLSEGFGTVRCQHGIIPVPVPAVLNIIKENEIRLNITNYRGEFVTPTGAAIAAAIVTDCELPGGMKIRGIGLGAGKRTYDKPSILRAMIIEEDNCFEENSALQQEFSGNNVFKLEANIDDSTGEALAYTMERLMGNGARDVYFIPCFMKKNRPGVILSVICDGDRTSELEKIIFTETTTIGIRKIPFERTALDRRFDKVETMYGESVVKICTFDDKIFVYPEFDSVAELSKKNGIPISEMFDIVKNAYLNKINS